jgi:hypothetical protein
VPLVGSDPLQLPEALQEVALVADQVSVAPCPAGTIELFNDSVTVEPPLEEDDEEPLEPDEELELLELPEDEELELPLDEELELLLEDEDEELLELDDELLLEDEPELLPEEGLSLLPPPHAVSARSAHTTAQARAMAVRWFVTLSPGEPIAAGAADKCRSCLAVLLLLTPSDAPCISSSL